MTVRNTSSLMAAVEQRVVGAGFDFYDQGSPSNRPSRRYVSGYEQTGASPTERLSDSPISFPWTVRLVVVALTIPGLRAAVADVRQLLLNTRLDADWTKVEPLQEIDAGPMLTDGPSEDIRYSQTLVYITTVTTRTE